MSGFLGQGLVNSFLVGDDTTGRLISKPFTIERQFIRFLVGGGHYRNTQIRLIVDGKVVRATSGKDNEQLLPAMWAVGDMQGRTAHIEIVDEQKGGWGHINVDQIEFSDMAGNRGVMELLEELLPARFSRVGPPHGMVGDSERVEFDGLVLLPGATQSKTPDGMTWLTRPVGKGKVVLAAGTVLEPARAGFSHHRQRAFALVCGLVGASYSASGGLQHSKAPGFGTLALAALAQDVTVLAATGDDNDVWKTFPRRAASLQRPTLPHIFRRRSVKPSMAGWPPRSRFRQARASKSPFYSLGITQTNTTRARRGWAAITRPNGRTRGRCCVRRWEGLATLRGRTEQFRQTFYDSTLPYWLLDCVTANAAIIRHIGVVFRIANGDVYGWEGSNGCCEPTCTHVWGYEQSLSRLFPALERDMRRIDFTHQQRADGGVNNRTDLPSPTRPTGEQPFADGHASCILKAYREALNHADEGFFKEYWPHIKRAVEYLIGRDAKAAGGQPEGILQDDQWNTYDEALHGVTTFISGYYLAALRAGEEWARRVGDRAAAERFHGIFEKGQKQLVELCWNEEYFQQHLPDYMKRQGEVGPGCMSDQLLGQWWAHQLGLGYILPRAMVVSALRAVFKYNFKSDLTGWPHAPRAFAGAKDKGLIICTWPKGGRPGNVMLYSDEVWTGIEYQAAAHMIYEGMIEEGFAIVKAARDRYDGIPRAPIGRNPWNEIECGGHYARAMSSWSLLLALSGWEYDGPRQALRLTPRHTPNNFKSFFAGPEGWGSLRQSREGQAQRNELSVREGRLGVAEIALLPGAAPKSVEVECGGKTIPSTFSFNAGVVVVSLKQPAVVQAGQTLMIRLA